MIKKLKSGGIEWEAGVEPCEEVYEHISGFMITFQGLRAYFGINDHIPWFMIRN